MDKAYQYGIMASGNLGLTGLRSVKENKEVLFVLTDKKSVQIQDYCREEGIAFFAGKPETEAARSILSEKEVDVILSINYLFLVGYDVLSLARKIAVNFHGSLLPKYRGRTPHVWSIINGETETGITAHVIDAGCDTGDILLQKRIPIPASATGGQLLERYNEMYPLLIQDVITKIESDDFVLQKQDEAAATYFGKRVPEDGVINWSWQKERIANWVRALAKPYPGAFTFSGKDKIIIHSIEYTNVGFSSEQPDGLIVAGGTMPLVKTPNGVVRLTNIESTAEADLKTGIILHA